MNTENEKYNKAKKKVEKLKYFYVHVAIYIAVNIFLMVIDLLDGSNLWFFWPLMGWGIGLLAHGASIFMGGLFSSEWEEKKIREFMDKDN